MSLIAAREADSYISRTENPPKPCQPQHHRLYNHSPNSSTFKAHDRASVPIISCPSPSKTILNSVSWTLLKRAVSLGKPSISLTHQQTLTISPNPFHLDVRGRATSHSSLARPTCLHLRILVMHLQRNERLEAGTRFLNIAMLQSLQPHL